MKSTLLVTLLLVASIDFCCHAHPTLQLVRRSGYTIPDVNAMAGGAASKGPTGLPEQPSADVIKKSEETSLLDPPQYPPSAFVPNSLKGDSTVGEAEKDLAPPQLELPQDAVNAVQKELDSRMSTNGFDDVSSETVNKAVSDAVSITLGTDQQQVQDQVNEIVPVVAGAVSSANENSSDAPTVTLPAIKLNQSDVEHITALMKDPAVANAVSQIINSIDKRSVDDDSQANSDNVDPESDADGTEDVAETVDESTQEQEPVDVAGTLVETQAANPVVDASSTEVLPETASQIDSTPSPSVDIVIDVTESVSTEVENTVADSTDASEPITEPETGTVDSDADAVIDQASSLPIVPETADESIEPNEDQEDDDDYEDDDDEIDESFTEQPDTESDHGTDEKDDEEFNEETDEEIDYVEETDGDDDEGRMWRNPTESSVAGDSTQTDDKSGDEQDASQAGSSTNAADATPNPIVRKNPLGTGIALLAIAGAVVGLAVLARKKYYRRFYTKQKPIYSTGNDEFYDCQQGGSFELQGPQSVVIG